MLLTRGGLREFETVMQNRDAGKGLHNFLPRVFIWGYVNMEKKKTVLYCFYDILLKIDSANKGKIVFINFLIQKYFLNTHSRQ